MISLEDVYFGNTLMQYGLFFGTILFFLVVGKISLFLLHNHFKRIASKTKTKIDDLIIYTIEKPIHLTFFVIGLYVALSFLIIDPSIYSTIHNILFVLMSINIAWYVLRFCESFLEEYISSYVKKSDSKLNDQLLPILKKAVRYVIILFSVIIILDNVGFDVTTLLAGLGIGGLALAIASQDVVSNIFGGITIFTDKPFSVGDRIKLDSQSGIVEEIGIRSSKLRTFDGTRVSIPNNIFSKNPIENLSKRNFERIMLRLGFNYSISAQKLKKAKEIIRDILVRTKGIDEKSITITLEEFGDFSIRLLVVYNIVDYEKKLYILDKVNTQIKERLEKEKIELSFRK